MRQLFAAATLAILASAPAEAQLDARAVRPAGEAMIYRDRDFRGPASSVDSAERRLMLGQTIRSIRVREGAWELCPRPDFRGPCQVIERDVRDLYRLFPQGIASMRPLGFGGGSGGGGGFDPAPSPTIRPVRGTGAEFHAQPARRSRRVESCPDNSGSANCAARTADRFCADNGWNGSAYQSQETVGRRIYLADVLCVRSGF